MFGLEGSGFTICLGIILLLTGTVMYYCKSKITACENRMNTMVQMLSELHGEVNSLKQQRANYGGIGATAPMTASVAEGGANEPYPQTEDETDSESEINSDEEQTIEVVDNGNMPIGIQISAITTSFDTHPYRELIPQSSNTGEITEVVNSSSESEGDTDSEDLEQEQLNTDAKAEVKVVDLGEIEELKIDDLNAQESDEESSSHSSEDESSIDYSKMQVTALKKLAMDRKLASNVHKLRKPELLALLQNN